MLYRRKNLDIGFVILCFDNNIGLLKNTVNSIKVRYNLPYICVVDNSINIQDFKELRSICQAYKAGKTFSSLINTGLKHSKTEWGLIVMAGTSVRPNIDQKFSLFIENNKDILFPVANRKINFIDGTINGLFVNKNTFQEIGDLPDTEPFEMAKAIWGQEAINKGCKFKAIVGSKMC